MTFKVPPIRNNTYMAVLGQEYNDLCRRQIVLNSKYMFHIPTSSCNIQFDETFHVRFTMLSNFEGSIQDLNTELMCKQTTDNILISNQDFTSTYITDELFKYGTQVQAVMFLHNRGETNEVIVNQGVNIGHPVSLRIKLDNVYTTTHDILPLVCAANDIIIMGESNLSFPSLNELTELTELSNIGCALPPFRNFTKLDVGDYISEFNMFRTIRNGIGDSAIKFSCLIYVCQTGTCPVSSCISP